MENAAVVGEVRFQATSASILTVSNSYMQSVESSGRKRSGGGEGEIPICVSPGCCQEKAAAQGRIDSNLLLCRCIFPAASNSSGLSEGSGGGICNLRSPRQRRSRCLGENMSLFTGTISWGRHSRSAPRVWAGITLCGLNSVSSTP